MLYVLQAALYFAIAMTVTILISVLLFCLATIPKYENVKIYQDSEWVFNSLFTAEFLLRIIVAEVSAFVRHCVIASLRHCVIALVRYDCPVVC